MRAWWLPLATMSLTGCLISQDSHDERKAQWAKDLNWTIDSTSPELISACADQDLTIAGSIAANHGGQSAIATVEFDGVALQGTFPVDIAGDGSIELTVPTSGFDLGECGEAVCTHTVAVRLDLETTGGSVRAESSFQVLPAAPPEVSPLYVVTPDGLLSGEDAVIEANREGGLYTSVFRAVMVGLSDPALELGTPTLDIYMCPERTDVDEGFGACTSVAANVVTEVPEELADYDIVVQVPLGEFAATSCSNELTRAVNWVFYADVQGHICDPIAPQQLFDEPLRPLTDDCDGDGIDRTTDCDNLDPEVGDPQPYFPDNDGDGYGEEGFAPNVTCTDPGNGWADNADDCDDTNPARHYGAEELCDGIDNDCDADVDNDIQFIDYYVDSDGDGYGDPSSETLSTCSGAPSGYVEDGTDCDDSAGSVNPGAAEVCNGLDENCDGQADNGLLFTDYYYDEDNDDYGDPTSGFSSCSAPPAGAVTDAGDCDDGDPFVNPAATETCNTIDDDCNGQVDDGLPFEDYYPDNDRDGYGEDTEPYSWCLPVAGLVTDNTDCDDTEATINPGATEECDAIDHDCDGDAYNGVVQTTYYQDNDGDGFADANNATVDTCDGRPDGYTTDLGDCDDQEPTVFTGAQEQCDGLDNDCNGQVDDGVSNQDYYRDADSDNYGNAADVVNDCAAPQGYVSQAGDCDDLNDARNPGLAEVQCDGIDNDCDNSTDDAPLKYADTDNDSYGDPSVSEKRCDTTGWVENADDCDDTQANINPATLWYLDNDNDGYGNRFWSQQSCTQPNGYVLDDTDCNDNTAERSPGNVEWCDGNQVDNDCDGDTLDRNLIGVVGSSDAYTDLQSALDSLDPNASPAEVLVCPGNYAGTASTDFPGTLTIRGTSLSDIPVLDGEQRGTTLAYSGAGELLLYQLDITNGFATVGDATDGQGGGLWAPNATYVELDDVDFYLNEAFEGGGAYITATDATLIAVFVSDNVAQDGGGAYLAGTVDLIESTFDTNYSTGGAGGGLFLAGGDFVFDTTDASNNVAELSSGLGGHGGGVAIGAGSTLLGLEAYDNTAEGHGGGIYAAPTVARSQTITLTDMVVSGNDAAEGGGVYAEYTSVTLRASTGNTNQLRTNTASAVGGNMVITESASLDAQATVFNGGSAPFGGGLAIRNARGSVENCAFTSNSTVSADSNTGQGGAVFIDDASFYSVLTGYTSNTSRQGGAIAMVSDVTTSQLFVEGGQFTQNAALDKGGAVWQAIDTQSSFDGSVDPVNFTSNNSGTGVGGVQLSWPVVLGDPAEAEFIDVGFGNGPAANAGVDIGHYSLLGQGTDITSFSPVSLSCDGLTGC